MLKSRKPKLLLKILFSFSLLGWFLWQTDLTQVLKALSSIPLHVFVLVTCIYFFALFVTTLKWKLLLQNYAMGQLFSLTLIAVYYSLILPGQLAGEAVKTYKLGKGKKDAEQIAASVIIDRITGLIGLMLVAIVGLIWSNKNMAKDLALWFGICISFSAATLYMFNFHFFEQTIRKILFTLKKSFRITIKLVDQCLRFIDAWVQYLKKPLVLLKSLSIGVFFQLICVSITLILAKAIGINIFYYDWCWVFGVISIVVLLPVTIGGVGLREGGFVLLLGYFGVQNDKALALSLSIFGLQITGALIGGAIDLLIAKK
jgi:uncharacterized protein (TIRG00374 family)